MTWGTTPPPIDPLELDCLDVLNKTSAVANGNGKCENY